MLLRGTDRTEIELSIVGYEYPETADIYDREWMTIEARVVAPVGSWQVCMKRSDILCLACWLQRLATKQAIQEAVFVDADYALEWSVKKKTTNKITLNIRFAYGLRPRIMPKDKSIVVKMEILLEDLLRAGDELQTRVNQFPERAPWVGSPKQWRSCECE